MYFILSSGESLQLHRNLLAENGFDAGQVV
jgi:hypothetical protein